MTPKTGPDPFFVGFFRKVPRGIAVVALSAGGAMVGVLLAVALALPLGMADPGSGRYANDLKGGVLTGVIEPLRYPILRVPAAADGPARAVLLGGNLKIGVQEQVAALATPSVTAGGVFVRRGDLEMLLMGGNGLAHKACANLCIAGGLPAVLVTALPVEGSTVVLLADADGGPMPAGLLDLTAVPVEMTGHLERRDDLLIFRIDTGSARAL